MNKLLCGRKSFKPRFCCGFAASLFLICVQASSEEIQSEAVPLTLKETHSALLLAVDKGDNDKAVSIYKRLLEIDPQLRGGYTKGTAEQNASYKGTLEAGQGEVARLFRDIPVLGTHVTKDDDLYQWLVKGFAGRDLCNSVVWSDSAPTLFQADAEHRNPSDKFPAEIRIKKRRARLKVFDLAIYDSAATHDEAWFSLVFELHNCQNYRRFHELRELSRYGVLSRDSFIAEKLRTELDAELKTKAFYVYEFYPLMQQRKVYSDVKTWRLHAPLTHAERIIAHRTQESAWASYGKEYDNLVEKKKTSKWLEQASKRIYQGLKDGADQKVLPTSSAPVPNPPKP